MYTLNELSEKLQMSSSVARRCVSYWQTRGVLQEETTDTYRLNTDVSGQSANETTEEDEAESAIASAEQQKEEELQVRVEIHSYWDVVCRLWKYARL